MTTRRIVIEGDIVRSEEITTLAEIPLDTMRGALTTQIPTTVPILPHGTRFFSYNPEDNFVYIIVETAPYRANMRFANAGTPYRVQLPYQQFAFRCNVTPATNGALAQFSVSNSTLWWTKTTLRSATDKLYPAAIPNVRHSEICWGGTVGVYPTLSEHIDAMVNSFNTTVFNGDLGLNTPDYNSDFRAWATASEDPLVYLNWQYWNSKDANGDYQTPEGLTTGLNSMAPVAELFPYFVDLPEAPINFTVGRATEWLNGLDERQRRRILTAVQGMTPTEWADELPAIASIEPTNDVLERIVAEMRAAR